MKEIIGNSFCDIFTTLAMDFITSHSLSQFRQIPTAENFVRTTQSYSKTLYSI